MRPFEIDIPRADVDDLRARLARTRWPDEVTGVGWDQGVPLAYLRELAGYWADGFDWRAAEAELNGFPQFRTEIDGQDIHFLHVRSPDPAATPLLVMHGWPGSVAELSRVLRPLSETFHVVAPSLPGYGFSGPTRAAGWDVPRIAAAFAELMRRLGYRRYGTHGGDWGAIVARELGRTHPEHVTGVHVTMLMSAVAAAEPSEAEMAALSEAARSEVRASLRRRATLMATEMGYGLLQSTRPQTLAYALTDSPVGQLAWIVEKFKAWSGCDDAPDEVIDRDQMLANVSLYWFTATAGSSARLYWETANSALGFRVAALPSRTPTGVASFPHDTTVPVRHLAERSDNIVHWTRYDRGGHFPAMEVPDLLVADVRRFYAELG